MKTSELTGALLNEWVARALGLRVELRKHSLVSAPIMVLVEGDGSFIRGVPHYSTDWAVAGQIIEREQIAVDPLTRQREPHHWQAQIWQPYACAIGATPLEAAMRAFISSKFGAEVPDDNAPAQPAAEP